MQIRESDNEWPPDILAIYAYAGNMKEHGNPDQWKDNYPPLELTTGHPFRLLTCLYHPGKWPGTDWRCILFHPEEDPDYRALTVLVKFLPLCRCSQSATARTQALPPSAWTGLMNSFQMIRLIHTIISDATHLLAKLGFTCCGASTLKSSDSRLIYQKTE